MNSALTADRCGPEDSAMGRKRIGTASKSLLGITVVTLVGAAGWYAFARERDASDARPSAPSAAIIPPAGVPVEVVAPRAGGIERVCVQPGSVEPFESADLYAKVSGYLVEQTVDIGYPVRAGEVLARISVPEYEKQVKQDTADLGRARAKVDQMSAAVTTAEADLGAATASVALAQAEAKSKTAYRAFREIQRNRIKDLAARTSIEGQLVDEQENQYQAAISADLAATESVNAAKQKEAAAGARIKQARADLKYATAEVEVAKAHLEKSQVLLDYTVIRSPYTGVVTRRNFHPGTNGQPGAFIKAAEQGGLIPLLTVERTDLMRVVVQVPDRDVPFVDVGDPAEIHFDALPDVTFKSNGTDKVEISRRADSEEPHTRMMRVEVHLKNPTGQIRCGMYGQARLILRAGAPSAVRVPSAALSGKAEGGRASVRVVRDDIAQIVPVRYGADNGSEVEILSGLTLADRVIVRASGPIDNGTQVTVGADPASKARR
jgi:HlyD family secretion protein